MAESGFIIDDRRYEIPTLDSMTMDEAQILYDCCGMALEDFAVDEEDPKQKAELDAKLKNPGFVRALMIITYMRGNQGMTRAKAEAQVAASNLFEAMKQYIGSADAGPPEIPSSSDADAESKASSSAPSGTDSTNGSAEPAVIPLPTGTSASESSPAKDPTPSGAGSLLT